MYPAPVYLQKAWYVLFVKGISQLTDFVIMWHKIKEHNFSIAILQDHKEPVKSSKDLMSTGDDTETLEHRKGQF